MKKMIPSSIDGIAHQMTLVLLIAMPLGALFASDLAGSVSWPGKLRWDWYAGLFMSLYAIVLNVTFTKRSQKDYWISLASLLITFVAAGFLGTTWSFYYMKRQGL